MTSGILGRLIFLVSAVSTIGLMALQARADLLETLVMPGPVIEGHAKLEEECSQCHQLFSKTAQGQLCRNCHKDVSRDIDLREGFHGRIKGVGSLECKQCHTEHKGRQADIVRLDRDTFDHRATDFALEGAHAKAECTACHGPKQAFRKAASRCVDCHREDDRHAGRLGEACADCHSEQRWAQSRFDHHKETGFALAGKHREAACIGCHVGERYKSTPKDCFSCHKLNDAHAGRLGAKCETCHTPRDWRKSTFDHGKETKFPLAGRHRTTECNSCHTASLAGKSPRKTCIACHRKDDDHKGRNGTKCGSCHTADDWRKPKFNHNKETKFPLRDKHAALACVACHKGQVFEEKLATGCYDCHRQDDVHKGQQGRSCGRCHNERGWRAEVFFDHDLTRFPLIGQHAVATCEECHLTPAFKGTETACSSCHAKDDAHKGRFGLRCGLCHNPNGWAFWLFDHDAQTDFPLDGAHDKVACETCHRAPIGLNQRMDRSCSSCHRKDDRHRGRFGRRCERCHNSESFSQVRVK